jgi:hypothetical protein
MKNNEIFVESDKGTGILADLNAWHAGNKVLKGRIIRD